MYEYIILMHHWFRWMVLFSGVWLLFSSTRGWLKNERWSGEQARLLWGFNQIFSYQVGFGLTLYLGISPITKSALANPELILTDAFTRFWVTEHGPTMLTAFGIFHWGRSLVKKRTTNVSKYKTIAITLWIILTMIILAIPWPFLSYGRPWIRLGFWEF